MDGEVKTVVKPMILRDTREKPNFGWIFPEDDTFGGTVQQTLKTGDYTIAGMEDKFVIERKRDTSELSTNVFEPRFEEELRRLEEFKFPFMVFEFDFNDVLHFPINSGIPQRMWPKLRVNSKFLRGVIARYQMVYKTKIIFAGRDGGAKVAMDLFKMVLKYGNK